MKINKYIIGLAVVLLGGLTSCNTDVEGTIYNSSLEHVSFDGSSVKVSVGVNETTATIPVTINRGVMSNETTVSFVAVASEDGIFSNDANGTVTFAAGQNTATFNVTAQNLEKEESYTYTLTLSDAAIATADTITKVKQNKVYKIEVTRDGDWTEWAKWNSKGTATYTYGNIWSGDDPGLPFTYRKSVLNENRYQFKLQNWGYGVEIIFDYDKSTGVVSCAPQFTGYTHSTYGDIYVTDLVNYCGIKGWSVAPTDYGTFDEEEGIITIPLAYYVSAGAFGYDPEFIYIDGYVRTDYTATLAYAGFLTDPDNNVFALGDLILSGKDAKNAKNIKAVVLEQDADASAVADAILAGDLEAVTVEGGRIQVAIPEGLSSKLQLIVAIIDKNNDGVDEVKNVLSTKFEYYSGANPWNSLGNGYFVDDFILPWYGKDPMTFEVEIQENTTEPGLYRLVKMYAKEAAAFGQTDGLADVEVNATNPSAVYILTQSIGFNLGYGDMAIATVGGDDIEYFAEKGISAEDVIAQYPEDFGTLADGVMNFPVFERTGQDGSTIKYQGYAYDDDGGAYACRNGAFKIVLPSAAANVKAQYKRAAAATNFALRLHGKTTAGYAVGQKMYKKIERRNLMLKNSK